MKFPINARNADSITLQRKIHDRYAVGEKKINERKQCPVNPIHVHMSLLDITESLTKLRNKHLFELVGRVHIPRAQVLDLAGRQPRLARVLLELGLAVDAAVGEQHEVWLDVALGVVGVGDVAGELVELRGTDGAHRACQAGVV